VWINVGPERTPELPVKKHATLRERWFDFEYAMDLLEARLGAALFAGDAFPLYYPNLGPELCGTVFGCELEFGEETSWSVPVVKSCRDIPRLKPNLDNVYWAAIRRATAMSIERGRGKWITGLPDFHTNGDLVASLREPQEMCLDCADDLDSVRKACDCVTDFYPQMYEDLWDPISAAGQPTTTWCPVPHAGKSYVTSCDFICMISKRMFDEAILPSIVREMRYLDVNMFHLDGPGALHHLDTLLALSELNGVQWVYGAGRGPASRWIDVYKRIQAAGKCIQLNAETIEDAKTVCEHLRPEGVWVCVSGYARAEAEAFVRWVERWGAGRA
jgi:hypothetical protein